MELNKEELLLLDIALVDRIRRLTDDRTNDIVESMKLHRALLGGWRKSSIVGHDGVERGS